MLIRIILLSSLSIMTACSTLEFPGVYRLPIEQGNIITEEMVAQLEPGMSPSQVEFVLGSALIKDPFTPNRWDYVYRIRNSDKSVDREQLTVYFEDDRLSHYETTVEPEPGEESKPTKIAEEETVQELAEEAEEQARQIQESIEEGESTDAPEAEEPTPGPAPTGSPQPAPSPQPRR